VNTYFKTVIDEIQLLIEQDNLTNFTRFKTILNSYRIPIMMYSKQSDALNFFNDYFFTIFGDIHSLQTTYPQLYDDSKNQFTLMIDSEPHDAFHFSVPFQYSDCHLVMINIQIEYGHLLANTEKFLLIDLIKKTSDFVGIADENGNYVYINSAGLKMLEMSAKDVHILNVWDLHNHKELKGILDNGTKEDGSFNWTGFVQLKTHLNHWIHTSQSITSHRIEGKTYYATVMRDISLLKKVEEQVTHANERLSETIALRTQEITDLNLELLSEIESSERMRYMIKEREEKLSIIIDTTLDGFFMLDNRLKFEQTNEAFREMLHVKYRELEGERFIRFLTNESKNQLKEQLKKIAAGEHVLSVLTFQCGDGVHIDFTISLNPFITSAGEQKGLFGFIRPLEGKSED
jgi:PAS domain S-box-containing protein